MLLGAGLLLEPEHVVAPIGCCWQWWQRPPCPAGPSKHRCAPSPPSLVRNDATFPAPHCCEGAACIPDPATARNLVLTYVRSDNYLPLLRQMECTFRKSNPGVELGVMTVKGELGPETTAWLASHNVTRFEVKPLRFPNKYNPRRDFLVDWRCARAGCVHGGCAALGRRGAVGPSLARLSAGGASAPILDIKWLGTRAPVWGQRSCWAPAKQIQLAMPACISPASTALAAPQVRRELAQAARLESHAVQRCSAYRQRCRGGRLTGTPLLAACRVCGVLGSDQDDEQVQLGGRRGASGRAAGGPGFLMLRAAIWRQPCWWYTHTTQRRKHALPSAHAP